MKKLFVNKLQEKIAELRPFFDESVTSIVDELLTRVQPFNSCSLNEGVHQFVSKLQIVSVALYPDALKLFKEEALEDTISGQFSTFKEDALYCEGTTGLLELLTRFRKVQTETSLVLASPAAAAMTNGKAVIAREDLECMYDDKRSILVIVVVKEGFISFYFEEKIAKKKK